MTVRTTDRQADFYTVEQIGRSQELTPEGYLLCREVPIARLGVMLYGPGELHDVAGNEIEPGADGIVYVTRDENEVFDPESMASANGKPFVNDHPDDDVNPDNWNKLACGVLMNPRRGTSPGDEGLLFGDLLVTNEEAIKAVRSGKRQISMGYDADYEQTAPGKALQRHIRYNHAALVDAGRCGSRCSIGDEDMAVKVRTARRQSFRDRIMAFVRARDEEGAAKALEGVEVEDDDMPDADGDQHIHIHLGGQGEGAASADHRTSDDDEGEGEGEGQGGDVPPWFKQHVEQNNARFDRIEGVLAKLAGGGEGGEEGEGGGEETNDETEEEREAREKAEREGERATDAEMECEPDGKTKVQDEERPEGETDPLTAKDKKTRDAALHADFQDAVAKAEIICPGVKLPTYDSISPIKATCLFRRRVLAKARRTDDTAAIVEQIMGKTPDLAAMTCDGVKTAFNAVAALAGQRNNGVISRLGTYDRSPTGGPKTPTNAEINARNRDFWKDRV